MENVLASMPDELALEKRSRSLDPDVLARDLSELARIPDVVTREKGSRSPDPDVLARDPNPLDGTPK